MSDQITMMPKYEAYKDSGVEWIGEIPENWEIKSLKYKLNLISEKFQSKQMKQLCYGMENIESWTGKFINGQTNVEGLVNKFCKHDILFGKLRPYLAKVALAKKDGFCSTEFLVYRARDDKSASYYKYLLLSSSFIYLIDSSTYGSKMPRASATFIGNQKLPIPPRQTQTIITNFLDCKAAKIDQAVAIKEKQIQLLKERRQILIQTAVTKGLDPDVPMRDSGVEWIGEVPGHWELSRFKYLFSQSNLPTRPDDGMVTSYRDGQVTLRSNRRLSGYTEAILEQGYQGIRKGQLVLNSMDAFEGAIGVSDSDGKCTPEYVICDPISDDLLPEYFAYLLREMALAKYIQVICNAVRQRAVRIRFNNLKTRFLIVPPIEEQKAIVTHIQAQSDKIGKAIAIQEQMIDKLKEYKATLINAAVTGKIKVPQTAQAKAVA